MALLLTRVCAGVLVQVLRQRPPPVQDGLRQRAVPPGCGRRGRRLPELDFGPLIGAAKAAELERRTSEALRWGATPLYRGSLAQGRFLPGQDTSAYHAPVTLLAPPGASRLMHEEPFGPADIIVVVDTEAELLAQMDASNGALVASRGGSWKGAIVGGVHLGHAVTEGPAGENLYGTFPGHARIPAC